MGCGRGLWNGAIGTVDEFKETVKNETENLLGSFASWQIDEQDGIKTSGPAIKRYYGNFFPDYSIHILSLHVIWCTGEHPWFMGGGLGSVGHRSRRGGGGNSLLVLHEDVQLDSIWFYGLVFLNKVYKFACLCLKKSWNLS